MHENRHMTDHKQAIKAPLLKAEREQRVEQVPDGEDAHEEASVTKMTVMQQCHHRVKNINRRIALFRKRTLRHFLRKINAKISGWFSSGGAIATLFAKTQRAWLTLWRKARRYLRKRVDRLSSLL